MFIFLAWRTVNIFRTNWRSSSCCLIFVSDLLSSTLCKMTLFFLLSRSLYSSKIGIASGIASCGNYSVFCRTGVLVTGLHVRGHAFSGTGRGDLYERWCKSAFSCSLFLSQSFASCPWQVWSDRSVGLICMVSLIWRGRYGDFIRLPWRMW